MLLWKYFYFLLDLNVIWLKLGFGLLVLGLYFEIGRNSSTVWARMWTFFEKKKKKLSKVGLVKDFALFYEAFKWEM